MALDPVALSVIFIGLALGSFIKGLTGMGFPMIAVPFLASFLSVEHAVVVVQIPNLVGNLWIVWSQRRVLKSTPLRFDLFGPALLMVAVGAWFLDIADDQTVIILLTVALTGYLILLWLNPDFRLHGLADKILTPVISLIGGFLQGATGVSGSIFSPLVYSLRLDKEVFVLYNGLLYGSFNVIQIAVLIWLGLFTAPRLIEGTLALLPLFLFQYLGMRMMRQISRTSFDRWVIFFLVVIEGNLLWQLFLSD